jgi:glycosyltransferase involved in cell wall biosynthesis
MTPRHIMMTTDTVGGVWIYAMALARRLAQQGTRVTLVTLGPPPTVSKYELAKALSPGVELIVTRLALEWHDPEASNSYAANDELLRISHEVGPDLVHLNSFREGVIAWPCPALVVAHSCVWSWWKATRKEWPSEPRWSIYREAVTAGLKEAKAWVAPTAAFRDTVQSIYQPMTPGGVIPNGIEITPPSRAAREPFILASGRVWDSGKNLIMLASVAGALPWPVKIAGAGVPLTEPSLPNVHWLGELDHADLQDLIQRAAIYAAPAYYEPFGLGILEAAAAGCALVLSDIESLQEIWDGAALFVSPDDPDQLRDTLLQLCRNEVLRARLQRASLARAQRYSLDCMLSGYLKIYSDIQKSSTLSAIVRQEARA